MKKLSSIAENFEEFNIQTKILNALKANIREQALDAQFYQKNVHHKHLKIRCLKTWIKLQNFIKAENKIIGE